MRDRNEELLVRYGKYSRHNLYEVLRKFGMDGVEAGIASAILDRWHVMCLEEDKSYRPDLTKTQRAKRLYEILRKYELIDIMFTGLMGNVWVDRKRKAYRLTDLAYSHLTNIIDYYQRKGEEVPRAILLEKARRDELRTA